MNDNEILDENQVPQYDDVNTTGRKRSVSALMKVLLIFNGVMTFIFGFQFLYSIFNVVGFDIESEHLIISRILAGLFLVAITDLAVVAWRHYQYDGGVTTQQMTTAKSAQKYSLIGSLLATIGSVILLQDYVTLPAALIYVTSGVTLIAAGLLSVMHVYWYYQYDSESEDATVISYGATRRARTTDRKFARMEEYDNLKQTEEEAEHRLKMAMMRDESEARLETAAAEYAIQRSMLASSLQHKKDVAQQTDALLAEKVHNNARKLADAESDRLLREFMAAGGHSYVPTKDRTE